MKSQNKKDKWEDTEKLLNWAFDSYTPVDVSVEFIALSAPEEISLGDGNLIVKKRDITCDGTRVLLTNRNDASGITVEFSRPQLSGDLQTAQMTASLYICLLYTSFSLQYTKGLPRLPTFWQANIRLRPGRNFSLICAKPI